VTAALRDGAGVGRWRVDHDGQRCGEVPMAHQQICASPVFLGREVSHELGPLYQLWHFARPMLVIAHHDHALEFNRNQLQHVRAKDWSTLGLVAEFLLGSAIGTAFGAGFTRHKTHFKTEFGKPVADSRLPLVEAHVRELTAQLSAAGRGLSPFDLEDVDLDLLTLNVLSDVCYGKDFARANFQEILRLKLLHDELMPDLGAPRTCMPGYRWLPTRLNRALRRYEARWTRFCRQAWSEIAAGSDCVVGHLRALEAAGALRLTEREVRHNLEEILLFNIDIINSVVGGLLVDLARRPEWQARLRREIAEQTGLSRAAPLTAAELARLTDMDNFITESARLRPPLSLTLPEELPCDMVIGGARVPAGTPVVIDCFTINHDPGVFPQPDSFDPDRFRGRAGLRHKMFRFGMGPRKCLGQNYATNILKTLLVHLLSEQHFSVADASEVLPQEKRVTNSRGEELRYTAPSGDVRGGGMAYFSPYLVFPRLRSVPLWRSPMLAPVIDAEEIISRHWLRGSAVHPETVDKPQPLRIVPAKVTFAGA